VGAGSANSTLIYTPVNLVIWEAYLYRPSFRPADTFLPIREKGLTYKQFCIAIQFFEYNNRIYPIEPLPTTNASFEFLRR